MSQYIKKLQTGGTVETQETENPKFKTATADYDARQLAADYEHNILAYAKHLGLKPGSKKYDEYITEAANIFLNRLETKAISVSIDGIFELIISFTSFSSSGKLLTSIKFSYK